MKARVGDRLVRDAGDTRRVCEIIGLHHADGSPPYVVRWLSDGHIALLYPGPYMRLVRRRGGQPAGREAAGPEPARTEPAAPEPAGTPAEEAPAGRAGRRARAARAATPPRRWPPNPFLARKLAARPHGAS